MSSPQTTGHAAAPVPQPPPVRTPNGPLDMLDGDFYVPVPGNRRRQIRLRTGLSLLSIERTAGVPVLAYIIWCLERFSMSHAVNIYRMFHNLDRFLAEQEGCEDFAWGTCDMPLFLRYLVGCRGQRRENDVILFRSFYRWACDFAYGGFGPAVADNLDSVRLRGEPKGMAVRTGDPGKGPLSDEIFREILRLLADDDGPLLARVCTGLGVELGANPAQYTALRASDLRRFDDGDGVVLYQLDMPRSKKADGYLERRRRPISPRLGQTLEHYIAATADLRADLGAGNDFLLLTNTGRPITTADFNERLREFFAPSPLADRPDAHMTQRRNRYTFASRLIAQGSSIDQIVDLLDHTHAGNVQVYYAQRADVVDRLDAAVGGEYAAMMERFAGRIVDSEGEADLGDRPAQRVRVSLLSGAVGIGTCSRDIAAHGLCQLAPPYSCYFCPAFQAWRNTDHGAFAATIRAERDDLITLDGDGRGDRVIGQLNELLAQVEAVALACADPPRPPLTSGRGRPKKRR